MKTGGWASTRSPDPGGYSSRSALYFVLLIGVVSLFADFTYEGSRSILGPYLLSLQASATVVGVVMGLGELLGYSLRLVSGRLADSTGRFWTITILGYVVQMAAVPALAFTHSWPAAALLIVLERIGKAIRNPPRDVMLSHAGQRIGGYGWAFGIHEALDQTGAMFGPLLMAAVLARHGSFQLAFAPLVFLGGFGVALAGVVLWGMGMGVHESIIPAAVSLMVPPARRASSFGLFTAGYGVSWFLGSATIGFLYDRSLTWTIAFCVITQLAAIPLLLWVAARQPAQPFPSDAPDQPATENTP